MFVFVWNKKSKLKAVSKQYVPSWRLKLFRPKVATTEKSQKTIFKKPQQTTSKK